MKKLLSIMMLGFVMALAPTSFAMNIKTPSIDNYLQLSKGQYMMPGRCWTDCGEHVVNREEHHGYGGYDHNKSC